MPSQWGNGTAVSIPEPLERLEDARQIFRLDEDVDVLRLPWNVRIVRERERTADQKGDVGVLQLSQRVDVEIGGRVVNRACSGGLHVTS